MEQRHNLTRTNSICPTPEELLLTYVTKNDTDKLRLLVNNNKELLLHVYDHPHYMPILHIACCEDDIYPSTVQTLLELGADPCMDSDNGEPLHIAARSTNSGVLGVLVKWLNEDGLNQLSENNGGNALHILILEGDKTKQNEQTKCAKILVDSQININQADSKNITPILWAAHTKAKNIVEVILNCGKTVDLDSHTFKGKTARQLIKENNLYEKPLPEPTSTTNNDVKTQLFSFLKDKSETQFAWVNNGNILDYCDADDNLQTLLQLACKINLVKAVQHLLNNKANPSKTIAKNPKQPVEIALENGYYEIVTLLLEADPEAKISSETLSETIKHLDLDPNYEKCFRAIMTRQNEFSINNPSGNLNTPLHYAVTYGRPAHIHDLLHIGASLASKNSFNIMPIEDIDADVLEEHLNNCIDIKEEAKEKTVVELNYRTLLPPQRKNTDGDLEKANLESGYEAERPLVPESEAIAYMCRAPHLRHLLTHPVIASFLFLKWHNIRKLFYANLGFYIIFFLSLLCYIFTSFSHDVSGLRSASFVILCVTYLGLCLRELFQVAVDPLRYVKNIENYLEVCLIVTVTCILFVVSPFSDAAKQLAAIAILLAAFELVLMVGQHPNLSTNVVMLKTVSYNFFKFLLWYSLLIIAFALSFYILFSNPTTDGDKNASQEGGDSGGNLFLNPGVSIFKTIVMLTGEFDASSINFDHFPITSKIIFIIFVLMIAITLLNLLNGLAVSDTQMIKNDAEYVGLIARTEHIFYLESMLLGNLLPLKLVNLLSLCCCFPMRQNITIIKPLYKYVMLPSHTLTVHLNEKRFVYAKNGFNKYADNIRFFPSCAANYLHTDIIRKTNQILDERKMKSKEEDLELKIKKIVTQILDEKISSQLGKIEKLVSVLSDKF